MSKVESGDILMLQAEEVLQIQSCSAADFCFFKKIIIIGLGGYTSGPMHMWEFEMRVQDTLFYHYLTDIWRGKSGFDIRGTGLTFGAECLRGELQSLDVLRSNIFQADGHLLGLTVEKLNGHRAGQLFFGQRLRRVGWPAQVDEEDNVLINWLEWAQMSLPCELYTSKPF